MCFPNPEVNLLAVAPTAAAATPTSAVPILRSKPGMRPPPSRLRQWKKCLIWTHSDSFTPDREAGGGSALPRLGGVESCSGVARSGKTFNSLSFPIISAHSVVDAGDGAVDARFVFCLFLVISVTYRTSAARGCSGVRRSGDPPYHGPIWPDLARFTSGRGAGTRGAPTIGENDGLPSQKRRM